MAQHEYKCPHEDREAIQYAILRSKSGSMHILDATEDCFMDDYFERKKKDPNTPQATFTAVSPADESLYAIVYGVLFPQCQAEITDWEAELKKYVNVVHTTVSKEENKEYWSAYADFRLFPEHRVPGYPTIPCALLLNTVFDFDQKQEFDFGYTTFIRYNNLEYLDNVLDRDYLFSLQGVEKSYENLPFSENWTKYINIERIKKAAVQFF